MIWIIFVLLCLSCQDGALKPQLTENRKLNDKQKLFDKKFDVNLDLMTKYKNKLYFVDWSQGQFNRFNLDDKKFEPTFGNYGLSPKEYLNVINYKVSDSSITSFDSDKSVYKNHAFSDTLFNYLKVPITFNAAVFKDDKILTMSRGAAENDFKLQFYIYDILKSTTKNLELDIDRFDKSFSGLSYNGYFAEGLNSKFIVYIPFESDFYMVFDKNFNFIDTGETLYKTPEPNFTMTTKNELVKDDYSYEVNVNASINNNIMYILTNVDQSDNNYHVDFYDLASLKYLGSYSVESTKSDTPREILIRDENMFILYHEKIEVFNI
ncbi:MAG: hypothetical protein L0J49_05745 [Lactococcus lactis]|nr:hypothetical protein [Lactococcus lactis]